MKAEQSLDISIYCEKAGYLNLFINFNWGILTHRLVYWGIICYYN